MCIGQETDEWGIGQEYKRRKLAGRERRVLQVFVCDPDGIRTHDPQLRRLLLYPAELPDQQIRADFRVDFGQNRLQR